MVSWVFTYVKTYKNCIFQYEYCTVYLSYLSKDVIKMKEAGRDLSWKWINEQEAGSRNGYFKASRQYKPPLTQVLLQIQQLRRGNLIGSAYDVTC